VAAFVHQLLDVVDLQIAKGRLVLCHTFYYSSSSPANP
jgi:hypothetical protein